MLRFKMLSNFTDGMILLDRGYRRGVLRKRSTDLPGRKTDGIIFIRAKYETDHPGKGQ